MHAVRAAPVKVQSIPVIALLVCQNRDVVEEAWVCYIIVLVEELLFGQG